MTRAPRKLHHRVYYALAALALAAAGISLVYTLRRAPAPHEPARLRLADATQPVSGLVYVAREHGHFERAGLRVAMQAHSTGKAALAAVLCGQADVATVAETPLVFAALNGDRFCILATIATTERNVAVVGRVDRGVLCPDDLRGKRVAVPPGTNAEFFFETFLLTRRIRSDDMRIHAMPPEAIPAALAEGLTDAAVAWHPHLGAAQRTLGDNGRSFYDEQIYTWSWNLVARRDWVDANPDAAWRLLLALAQAEEHAAGQPEDAKRIVAAHCSMDPRDLDEMWPSYHFRLTLGQWLILAMESQAQWARKQPAHAGKKMPDFRGVIYIRALESVRPEAVTVVR